MLCHFAAAAMDAQQAAATAGQRHQAWGWNTAEVRRAAHAVMAMSRMSSDVDAVSKAQSSNYRTIVTSKLCGHECHEEKIFEGVDEFSAVFHPTVLD
jgi:hypothetical protein